TDDKASRLHYIQRFSKAAVTLVKRPFTASSAPSPPTKVPDELSRCPRTIPRRWEPAPLFECRRGSRCSAKPPSRRRPCALGRKPRRSLGRCRGQARNDRPTGSE